MIAMALIGMLTMGAAQAVNKKPDDPSDRARVDAAEKKWTPPPGRLPDSILKSPMWDSGLKKHQDQMPGQFNQAAQVPEPATLVLVGAGLLGLIASRKRKK